MRKRMRWVVGGGVSLLVIAAAAASCVSVDHSGDDSSTVEPPSAVSDGAPPAAVDPGGEPASPTSMATPSTTVGSTVTSAVIADYGDFSGVSHFEADWVEVFERVQACVEDQGFDVELAAGGDGILYTSLPEEQRNRAAAAAEACMEAMSVPEYEPLTEEQILEVHAYWLAVAECLEAEGVEVSPAPSPEVFIEEWATGPWSPYQDVPPASESELRRQCPEAPVGGYGAWEPGDPVRPAPSR